VLRARPPAFGGDAHRIAPTGLTKLAATRCGVSPSGTAFLTDPGTSEYRNTAGTLRLETYQVFRERAKDPALGLNALKQRWLRDPKAPTVHDLAQVSLRRIFLSEIPANLNAK
jgi:hypothetical protein